MTRKGHRPPCEISHGKLLLLLPARCWRAPHSITSLASASSVGGTVRPSAFAVLRLMTSSNFVGSSTGRPDGFARLRILLGHLLWTHRSDALHWNSLKSGPTATRTAGTKSS